MDVALSNPRKTSSQVHQVRDFGSNVPTVEECEINNLHILETCPYAISGVGCT
jgi:hypothetical protein